MVFALGIDVAVSLCVLLPLGPRKLLFFHLLKLISFSMQTRSHVPISYHSTGFLLIHGLEIPPALLYVLVIEGLSGQLISVSILLDIPRCR